MNGQKLYENLLAYTKVFLILVGFVLIGYCVYYVVISPKMLFDAVFYCFLIILIGKFALTYSIRDYNRRRIGLESLESNRNFLEYLCNQDVVIGISERDKEIILETFWRMNK